MPRLLEYKIHQSVWKDPVTLMLIFVVCYQKYKTGAKLWAYENNNMIHTYNHIYIYNLYLIRILVTSENLDESFG